MHLYTPRVFRRICCLAAPLLALILYSGCASLHSHPSPEELETAYYNAVRDAAIADPDEISRNLTAITAHNPDLIWQGRPGASRVLVVTWTDYEGYKKQVGMLVENPVFCWVTVVPALRDFCRSFGHGGEQCNLRLKQLLGLPPGSEKNLFVEMWVHPRDLFRPSPDPEITDHEGELDFPESDRFLKVSDAHRQWFNDLKSKSYTGNPYPWTRLGYTYDWGNPRSEVGLSEFVVQKRATVEIKSVSTLFDYCR